MSDPSNVVFTVKELLQRLDERLGALDSKLDIRLAQIDERVTHIERTSSERQYLIAEHETMKKRVESLWLERSSTRAIYADRRFWVGIAFSAVPLAALVAQYLTS